MKTEIKTYGLYNATFTVKTAPGCESRREPWYSKLKSMPSNQSKGSANKFKKV